MRLSSGPEHSVLTNRPVIVTQSVLPSAQTLPLRKRGSPYSRGVRRAAARRLNKHGGARRLRTTAMLAGKSLIACAPAGGSTSLKLFETPAWDARSRTIGLGQRRTCSTFEYGAIDYAPNLLLAFYDRTQEDLYVATVEIASAERDPPSTRLEPHFLAPRVPLWDVLRTRIDLHWRSVRQVFPGIDWRSCDGARGRLWWDHLAMRRDAQRYQSVRAFLPANVALTGARLPPCATRYDASRASG
jgi:hypothetical protein